MTKQIKLIEGKANLEKEFGLLKAAGKKLDDRIQLAGLSIINHIDKHGDITLVVGLMDALPKGARSSAMIEWLLAHAKLEQNIIDGKVSKDAPWLYAKGKATKMEAAIESPWYTFKPEKLDEPSFDFQAMLNALLSKATKAAAAGKEVKGADQLARIQLLLAEPAAE
ncbi:hypothetical protein [Pseudomonas phage Eisa9]|uniref:Uncharacterized protein n=1 Tax=Pseudomonas phage Eisa9 TaxID=2900148 RepID=A0AAE8YJ02_9CAUD|nr:hypothetical protein [Pseudomonas phage Eisa9]